MPCHATLFRRLSGLHGRREGTPLLTRAGRTLASAARAISSTAAALWRTLRPHLRGLAVAGGLLATIGSSLSVYPHQLAYFNEAAGGPENGYQHLLHSNLDWGQDLLFLRDWQIQHGAPTPLFVAAVGMFDPGDLGIRHERIFDAPIDGSQLPNGWYAVSAMQLYDPDRHFGLLRTCSDVPVRRIGESLYLFRVDTNQH